jgi:uracil phosphoribosyltransferase
MNVKILNWQEDKNFSQQMWQAAVGLTFEAFKNHPKDQFATKIPIEGNINTKIDTDIFTTIIRVLRNGFVEAYKKTLDNSVSFSGGNKDEVKDKKFLFFKIKK